MFHLVKEKADLLLEVERLSLIRDELTDDISELHESLEKERSKVSKLKDEIKVSIRTVVFSLFSPWTISKLA